MSKTEAVEALEHAHVPVHRFIGAPGDLPEASRRRGRLAEALHAYGETLGRLQKSV